MGSRFSYGAVATVVLVALLAGCASAPTPVGTPTVPWETHNKRVLDTQEWHLEGKMGYRGNGEGGSAWVDWRQTGASFEVHLSGPFGAGVTRLYGDDQGAVLSEAGHEDRIAPTPGLLTAELFGWTLPVEQLRYWVRGVPDPQLPVSAMDLNVQGVLGYLQQQGWELRFDDYRPTPIGILPGKILASRDSTEAGAIRVTLVVKAWHLNSQRY